MAVIDEQRALGPEFRIQAIGLVRNGVEGPERPSDWCLLESDLVIDARWIEALDGVERLERLAVIWWFDRREGEEVPLKIHPRGDRRIPLTGLFVTRAPIRPNLLALTTVSVLGRDGNVIHVRGLDAFDGSPILDLKPILEHPSGGRDGSSPHRHSPDP